MKNLSIVRVLGCVLVTGYWCCERCDAQTREARSAAREYLGVNAAAEILVQQLGAAKMELRENAATALQAMGRKAAKTLATYVRDNLSGSNNPGVVKAVIVLGKIGNDVADDDDVQDALRSAASPKKVTDWPELQLAAIDALREINKYRGGILSTDDDDPQDTLDPAAAIVASDKLAQIAENVFVGAKARSGPTPTPTPAWDEDFYAQFKIVRDSQAKLVKDALLASATAPSKPEQPPSSRLSDAKTLAVSLKKILSEYLDATKSSFSDKPADQPDDKSRWQLKTEAAYELLVETRELRNQLHQALGTFKKNQDNLAALVSILGIISANSNSEATKTAVASALNGIFSKVPEKKSAAESAKKNEEKKEGGKKEEAVKE